MSRLHRLLVALVPPPRDQWIRAHAAELARVEGRGAGLRWLLGVIPIVGWALASQLLHEPRSFLGSTVTRAIAGGLSFVNLIAGVTLVVIYLAGAQALPMLGLGLALAIQATSGLAYLRGLFARHSALATSLVLSGSAVAAGSGLVVFSTGFAANIGATGDDPEYGPMTIGLLIGAHGIASLLAFSRKRRDQRPSRSATP